jgi:hypothetical protein
MHGAIYDAARDRMLVFGGLDASGMRNDVWELARATGAGWRQLSPSGTPPVPRYQAAVLHDPLRDRMVVFGGHSPGALNDTWVLSLAGESAWLRLQPPGALPGFRGGHVALLDAPRDRMFVFGGTNGAQHLGDAWTLPLSGDAPWSPVTTSVAPAPRSGASGVYDAARQRAMIFGGTNATGFLNEVWSLSFAGSPVWEQQGGSPTPTARSGFAYCLDPVAREMIVHSGTVPLLTGGASINDVWALRLDGSGWRPIQPAGTLPLVGWPRVGMYDPVRHRMLVLRGIPSSDRYNDLLALRLGPSPTWDLLLSGLPAPPQRNHFSAIYDPLRDRVLMFGGAEFGVSYNDVWEIPLSAPQWIQVTTQGTPPAPRAQHSAIYDPLRDRMVVFGGTGDLFPWALHLGESPPRWARLEVTGPAPRQGHVAVHDPLLDRMIVFGGSTLTNETWELVFGPPTRWTRIPDLGVAPEPRQEFGAVYDPAASRIVIFGGVGAGSRRFADVWALTTVHTPTATVVDLEHVDARPHLVRLVWYVAGPRTAAFEAYREEPGADPVFLGRPVPDGEDRMSLEDREVRPGARYIYRLDTIELDGTRASVRVPVTVPGSPAFAVRSAVRPAGAVTIEYTLESDAPCRIEVCDVAGRLLARWTTNPGAGSHSLEWQPGTWLRAGVYLVRLVQEHRTATTRFVRFGH